MAAGEEVREMDPGKPQELGEALSWIVSGPN